MGNSAIIVAIRTIAGEHGEFGSIPIAGIINGDFANSRIRIIGHFSQIGGGELAVANLGFGLIVCVQLQPGIAHSASVSVRRLKELKVHV